MPLQTFYALIHREEDLYVAFCPEAGTASQGSSPEEALANVCEATKLYLEDFPIPTREGPVLLATFQVDYPKE